MKKASDNIHYLFMIKLSKLGVEGSLSTLIKVIYNKTYN